MDERDRALAVVLAGAAIGAAVAWWLSAVSRDQLRAELADYVASLKDQLLERGKRALQTAVEHGLHQLERDERPLQETGGRSAGL